MSTPQLPTEVWERVIDWVPHYHGSDHHPPFKCENETLIVCALVCRSWLPRSQTRLFQIVKLSNARQAEAFLDVITRSPSIRLRISTLILSPKPPATSTFEVIPARSQPDLSTSPGYYNWFHRILNTLPVLIVNVMKLQLENLPMLHPVSIALLSRFKQVQVLLFKDCSQQSFTEIIRLVNRFSHLHTLDLYQCNWRRSAHCYSGKQHNLKRLGLTMIQEANAADTLTWITSSHSTLALDGLEILSSDTTHGNMIKRLSYVLQHSRNNLQYLRLALQGSPSRKSGQYLRYHKPENKMVLIQVGLFPSGIHTSFQQSSLKHIHLAISNIMIPTLSSGLFLAFPTSIIVIQLDFWRGFEKVINQKYQDKWSSLDTFLCDPKYQRLKCFTLWTGPPQEPFDNDSILQILCTFFPKLIETQILWWGNSRTSIGM